MFGRKPVVLIIVLTLTVPVLLFAGVSKEIETQYQRAYENKALFLRVPIRGEKETIFIRGNQIRLNTAADISGLRFRVGEQVRVTSVDFEDSHVEFKVASIDQVRQGEIHFQFRQSLTYSFPERPVFDRALATTFTEGLSYQEIEKAKETFIQRQFEQQVREFVSMAGVSDEFVMKAVAEKNPQFETIQKEVAGYVSQIESLQQQLEAERGKNQDFSQELRTVRNELAESQNTNRLLERKVENLSTVERNLRNENEKLLGDNQNFQRQIENIAGKLDLETDSRTQLNNQVDVLSLRIETLNRERDSLSSEVEQLSDELAEIRREKEKLARDLQSEERQSNRLRSNLNALTSNRDSLESKFIRTKNEKESLELARRLEETISVETREERMEGKFIRVSDVFLLEHRIGEIKVEIPESVGDSVSVELNVTSPDTVQFGEEARNLYQALGEGIRLRPDWESWSGELDMELQEGEEVQVAGPRESSRWVWTVLGEPQTVQRLSLVTHLINEDDHTVFLNRQDFEMIPSGLLSNLSNSFSLSSLAVGFLIGFAGVGIIVALRTSGAKKNKKKQNVEKRQIQKEL